MPEIAKCLFCEKERAEHITSEIKSEIDSTIKFLMESGTIGNHSQLSIEENEDE